MPAERAGRHDLGREDALRDEDPGVAEVEGAGAGATVLRDLVDRHLRTAVAAQGRERGQRVVEQPRVGVVPVHDPGVGTLGDAGEGRVVAVLVEVVEAQDREAEALGQPGLAGTAGAGEDDDPGGHVGVRHG